MPWPRQRIYRHSASVELTVHRLYRPERPALRREDPQRRVSSRHRDDRPPVEAADRARAIDSLSDTLADGRELRILAFIDPFTRECRAIRVDTRSSSGQVAEMMAALAPSRSASREARVNDGP